MLILVPGQSGQKAIQAKGNLGHRGTLDIREIWASIQTRQQGNLDSRQSRTPENLDNVAKRQYRLFCSRAL
jgi:hypothetical protein